MHSLDIDVDDAVADDFDVVFREVLLDIDCEGVLVALFLHIFINISKLTERLYM